MIKLLKYEFFKKWRIYGVVLALFIILDTVLISNQMADKINKEDVFGLYVLMVFGMFLLVFIDNIEIFRKDLFNNTGYLFYGIPKNGYEVLGSKILFIIGEWIIAGSVALLVGIINTKILLSIKIGYDIEMFIKHSGIGNISFAVIQSLIMFLVLILNIYLAISIFKSWLSNVKYGRIGSFAIFILINYIEGKLYGLLEPVVASNDLMIKNTVNLWASLYPHLILTTLSAIGLFVITGYLLENKVNI